MVVAALRGALGFLTRLPVGHDEGAWEAFRTAPAAFPVTGYVIGALVALPVVAPVPAPVAAFGFLAAVYLVTGVNHVDGLADLGDAAAVHGAGARRDAMKDTTTGVGALAAVGLMLAGLALAGLALAGRPPLQAFAVVVAAEVGAKLGMAVLASFGHPAHEGMGAQLARNAPTDALPAVVLALPVALLSFPTLVGATTLTVAVLASLAVGLWAQRWLGGVSGDVFGAANELARVAALHAGVVAWTLS
ncbi:adenosylcobinamide-GDP ribazoletransferase [Halobacteriaceae archaeon GCM10025711]